jgi:hypothetical protein
VGRACEPAGLTTTAEKVVLIVGNSNIRIWHGTFAITLALSNFPSGSGTAAASVSALRGRCGEARVADRPGFHPGGGFPNPDRTPTPIASTAHTGIAGNSSGRSLRMRTQQAGCCTSTARCWRQACGRVRCVRRPVHAALRKPTSPGAGKTGSAQPPLEQSRPASSMVNPAWSVLTEQSGLFTLAVGWARLQRHILWGHGPSHRPMKCRFFQVRGWPKLRRLPFAKAARAWLLFTVTRFFGYPTGAHCGSPVPRGCMIPSRGRFGCALLFTGAAFPSSLEHLAAPIRACRAVAAREVASPLSLRS